MLSTSSYNNDDTDNSKTTNPRDKAYFFSVAIWYWVYPLFGKRNKRTIIRDDLYVPRKKDYAQYLGDKLEKNIFRLAAGRTGEKLSNNFLFDTLLRTFKWDLIQHGFLHGFLEIILRIGGPLLIRSFLLHFNTNKDDSESNGAIVFAACLVFLELIKTIVQNQSTYMAFNIANRMDIALKSVMYRKILRLKLCEINGRTGNITNHFTTNLSILHGFCLFVNFLWSTILMTIGIICVICFTIDYSALYGVLLILVVAGFQKLVSRLEKNWKEKGLQAGDERVNRITEIFSSIQVIKMYVWEKAFSTLVKTERQKELTYIRYGSLVKAINVAIDFFMARAALFIVVLVQYVTGEQFSAQTLFTVNFYLQVLTYAALRMFIPGISETYSYYMGLRRIQKFLFTDEVDNKFMTNIAQLNNLNRNTANVFQENPSFIGDNGTQKENSIMPRPNDTQLNSDIRDENSVLNQGTINIDCFSAKWNKNNAETTLESLRLKFTAGKLYMIIGPVGGGKSSLFSAILGEIDVTAGAVTYQGDLSYASQDPWIFGASVRQNILFGEEYDENKYHDVVKACALLKDFEQFPNGDQTVVGDQGSCLSGGQKARLNLARAVYRKANIYLLDDPLSAVDARVGKHLFQECIQGNLQNCTRLLITHQLQYIQQCDGIILIEEGKAEFFNDFEELQNTHTNYKNIIMSTGKENVISTLEIPVVTTPDLETPDVQPPDLDDSSSNKQNLRSVVTSSRLKIWTRRTGRMFTVPYRSVKNYIAYWKMENSWPSVIFMILLFPLAQAVGVSCDYFFAELVSVAHHGNYLKNSSNENLQDIKKYDDMLTNNQIIYASLMVLLVFVCLLRSVVFCNFCDRNSQYLHNKMFDALIRTKMEFFDTNPSGVIIDKFSKEINEIDRQLPDVLISAMQMTCIAVGSLIAASLVGWIFAIVSIVVFMFFLYIRNIYLNTSKDITLLETESRTEQLTYINATLNGLSTIRAHKGQSVLIKQFDELQNTLTSATFCSLAVSTTFGFWLDSVCFVLTAFSFVFLTVSREDYTSSEAGFAILQMTGLAGYMQWGVRQAAQVETLKISVDKIREYIKLPAEANLKDERGLCEDVIDDKSPINESPPDCSTKGRIEFNNVSVRYSEKAPEILKNLNFHIKPHEKIGIVGRTGAGKSSLISALHRLAINEGDIIIDGKKTSDMLLHNLRKQICVIPQDPVLFKGTLKFNLDPFYKYSDAVMWNALEEVQLKNVFRERRLGLDIEVSTKGTDYSVGQRQLICLARAILRNNRILVLDEATANVDLETEKLIQKAIRENFKSSTVLIVAHRLDTIIDSDRVMMMDKGRLVEFDHPYRLLCKDQGHFRSLVDEAGEDAVNNLTEKARKTFESANNI